MCGLVGSFGWITRKVEEITEDLLQIDVIRGRDSTGMAIFRENLNSPVVIKDVWMPDELMASKSYEKQCKNMNFLMMGHNRAATLGKVTKENAHPFKVGHITLAHNGTIYSKHSLPDHTKFDTDSEAITFSIFKEGIEKTWKNLSGAATITYWDNNLKSLFFISNKQRPFHFLYEKNKDSLIWASEAWMLRGVVERRKMGIHENTHYYLESNTLYEFKYDTKKKKVRMESSTKLEKSSITYRGTTYVYNKKPATRTEGEKYWDWEKEWENAWKGYAGEERATETYTHCVNIQCGNKLKNPHVKPTLCAECDKKKQSLVTERKKDNVVPFATETQKQDADHQKNLKSDNIKFPNMTIGEFRERYQECVFCQNSLFGEYGTAVPITDDCAACESCARVAEFNNINLVAEVEG